MRFIKRDRPRLRTGRSSKFLVTALTAALVLAAPGIVLARGLSHDFADVPTAHQFHTQISAIKGAGITTGCGGGNYCPDEFVRRDAMAAFMHRGYGRVAQTSTLTKTLIHTATSGDIASVTINVPGVSGMQFVLVQAQWSIRGTGGTDCTPCTERVDLIENGSTAQSEFDAMPQGSDQETRSISHVFPATSGTHTYTLAHFITSTNDFELWNLNLTAATYPFGSTGGSTLGASGASTATPHGTRP